MRIALCDDDPDQLNATVSLLESFRISQPEGSVSVETFTDGAELLSRGNGFDIYLLDILMPGLDGISLARSLRVRDADIPIIFLTSSTDYALEAFSVSAFQYLLKPVESGALYAALKKIAAVRAKGPEDSFIMVQTRENMRRVPFASIVSVEIWGRSLRFSLTDGEEISSRTVRGPFTETIAALLADSRFLYAHKSYVLNMERVYELRPRSFVMTNGQELPIPRHKYAEAKNRYFDYLSARGIGMVSRAP
jgi:DNA-binding LytR/AlgR family response regulator